MCADRAAHMETVVRHASHPTLLSQIIVIITPWKRHYKECVAPNADNNLQSDDSQHAHRDINRFIQGEVIGFQALLNSLQPRYARTSQWSPPSFPEEKLYQILASASSGIRAMCPVSICMVKISAI